MGEASRQSVVHPQNPSLTNWILPAKDACNFQHFLHRCCFHSSYYGQEISGWVSKPSNKQHKKASCYRYPWSFPLVSTSFSLLLFIFPLSSFNGMSNWKKKQKIRLKYSNQTQTHQYHSCHTLFLPLAFPGLNFFSVCLVWISMRSSSPASALSRLFWLCFLVPVGARLPTISFGLGPFFFPGGRPEFWDAVRGALESGEPGNGGPARPMFCWKMSCQRICAHFSLFVKKHNKVQNWNRYENFSANNYVPQPVESPWQGLSRVFECWWFLEFLFHGQLMPIYLKKNIKYLIQH